MSKYLEKHNKLKEQVIQQLDLAAKFYEKRAEDIQANSQLADAEEVDIQPRLQQSEVERSKAIALRNLIKSTQEGEFLIVVVGEFSAGKSTFLNALMGDRYLPSFSSETTATINILRSIKGSPTCKEMVRVNYKDGTQETSDKVDLATIEKFVSTKGDKAKVATVKSVDVFFDSKFLEDGVCLVDSPGLNGVLEGHKEITDQQIKNSHAAIFMFSAAQPGKESDFKILKMLKKDCDSVLIALNRIDEVRESEQTLDDVIAKLKENYKKQMPDEGIPEIHPIAAYPALVARSKDDLEYHQKTNHSAEDKAKFLELSRIEAFEDRLMRYLTQGEKTKKELQAPLERIQKFLEDSKAALSNDIATLQSNTDAQELEAQIESINQEREKLNERIENSTTAIEAKIHEIIVHTQHSIKAETKDIKDKYISKIGENEEIHELESNAKAYINRLDAEYQDVYQSARERVDADYRDMLFSQFADMAKDVDKALKAKSVNQSEIALSRLQIDDSIFNCDFDLSDINQKRDALLQQQDQLEGQDDELAIRLVHSQQKDIERQHLKAQLNRAEERTYEQLKALGSAPSVRYRTVYKREKANPGGIGGGLRWLLLGNKYEIREYQVADTSAQDAYEKQREEIKANGAQDIKKHEDRLAKLPASDTASIEYEQKRIERAKRNVETALERLDDEMRRKIEKEKKQRVLKAKSYLEDCIEQREKEGRASFLNQLEKQRENMADMAYEIIRANMEDVLISKDAELQNMRNKLTQSQEWIEKEIAHLQGLQGEALSILHKTEDLMDDIDNIPTEKLNSED